MKIFYAISENSVTLMDNTAAQPMVNELKSIFFDKLLHGRHFIKSYLIIIWLIN